MSSPSATRSACFGDTSRVAVLPTLAAPLLLSSVWSMASTRTSVSSVSLNWRVSLPSDPFGGDGPLDRENDVDEIAGEHEAGDARRAVDGDRHRALAGIEDRREKALFARMDDARRGDRLAGVEVRADDRARQVLLAGLALDQVGLGQTFLRPRPPLQLVRLDEGPRRHGLLGDQDLGRRRRGGDSRRLRLHRDLLAGKPAVHQERRERPPPPGRR